LRMSLMFLSLGQGFPLPFPCFFILAPFRGGMIGCIFPSSK